MSDRYNLGPESKWSIYALCCPDSGEVRYVGWTTKPLDKRLRGHINEACSTKRMSHRIKWLRRLHKEGKKPLIELIEEGMGPDWEDREKFWIAHQREAGAGLVNATEGGIGKPDSKTPIAIRKESLANALKLYPAVSRSEKVKKYWNSLNPEERIKRLSHLDGDMTKAHEALRKLSPERLAERGRKIVANRKKVPSGVWSAIFKKYTASLTPEQRSIRAKHAAMSGTAEERSERARQAALAGARKRKLRLE